MYGMWETIKWTLLQPIMYEESHGLLKQSLKTTKNKIEKKRKRDHGLNRDLFLVMLRKIELIV